MKESLYNQAVDIVHEMRHIDRQMTKIVNLLSKETEIDTYDIYELGLSDEVQLAMRHILRARLGDLEKQLRRRATDFERL